MSITVYDEFCGTGGTSRGFSYVPDVKVVAAANHNKHAIAAHALNFPGARHFTEDVTKLDLEQMPHADAFAASPICPPFTTANGVRVDFDLATKQQSVLFNVEEMRKVTPAMRKRLEEYKRGRLLMHEPLRYLRAQVAKGTPVLIGVIENVPQARKWSEFDKWRDEFHALGYRTRLIALNSMHAQPVLAPWVPQSRDRLFLAYWHKSLKRQPDWDKWLRPRAYCPQCDEAVYAVQVWKKAGVDMGVYGRNGQYEYHCPSRAHRQEVFPPTLPALAAIDPNIPGTRIGDRTALNMPPLEVATMERIRAGIARYWLPLMTPTGGTWRDQATQLGDPAPTRTTRETDAVALPPLIVPVEGRPGKNANPATGPVRTQTARNETGVMALPFITPLRGGGSKGHAYPITDPAGAVSAGGNHHGLALPTLLMRNNTVRNGDNPGYLSTPVGEPARSVTSAGHQSLLAWRSQLLVPYYGNERSKARPAGDRPCGTLSTRDSYGLAAVDEPMLPADVSDEVLADVLFRMLEPDEIRKIMGFGDDWRVLPGASKKTLVFLYGNAVTPACAEVIMSALVECLTGEDLPRGDRWALAA
jgi:DNA (cytosine-5)-methyltransferase 1